MEELFDEEFDTYTLAVRVPGWARALCEALVETSDPEADFEVVFPQWPQPGPGEVVIAETGLLSEDDARVPRWLEAARIPFEMRYDRDSDDVPTEHWESVRFEDGRREIATVHVFNAQELLLKMADALLEEGQAQALALLEEFADETLAHRGPSLRGHDRRGPSEDQRARMDYLCAVVRQGGQTPEERVVAGAVRAAQREKALDASALRGAGEGEGSLSL